MSQSYSLNSGREENFYRLPSSCPAQMINLTHDWRNTLLQCCCIERLLDPPTHKPLAAYGWIEEGHGMPRQYWVSIEDDPIQFFREENTAKLFYEASIEPMIASVCQTCTNGQIKRNGNHKRGRQLAQANGRR